MLIGYARVSTADQNPAHQTDALMRAGVAEGDIYVDHASGARASRPQIDAMGPPWAGSWSAARPGRDRVFQKGSS